MSGFKPSLSHILGETHTFPCTLRRALLTAEGTQQEFLFPTQLWSSVIPSCKSYSPVRCWASTESYISWESLRCSQIYLLELKNKVRLFQTDSISQGLIPTKLPCVTVPVSGLGSVWLQPTGYKSEISTTPSSSVITCYDVSQNSGKHCLHSPVHYKGYDKDDRQSWG